MFSSTFREVGHFRQVAGTLKKAQDKNLIRDALIQEAINKGGVGIIRLASNVFWHEGAGMEAALVEYLKKIGGKANDRSISRNGSYADMSQEQPQDAGESMVKAGMQKWCEGDKIFYVKKLTKDSLPNARLINDCIKEHTILKHCRAGQKCSRFEKLDIVDVVGFCKNCCSISSELGCDVEVLGHHGGKQVHCGGKCAAQDGQMRRKKSGGKAIASDVLSHLSIDVSRSGHGHCGKCSKRFKRNSIRVKQGKFYHPICLKELYVPDIAASKFSGYDKLTSTQQASMLAVFPDKVEEDNDSDVGILEDEDLDNLNGRDLNTQQDYRFDGSQHSDFEDEPTAKVPRMSQ